MPIPDYQTLMFPVLRAFCDGPTSVKSILPMLREEFAITDEEAQELIPSGSETVLANRAHWARTYLSKAGLLRSPKRNLHEITEAGTTLLASGVTRIDNRTLSKMPGFSDWKDLSKSDQPKDQVDHQEPSKFVGITPEDQMASSYQVLHEALALEILDRLFEMNPLRFERLILDLLKAMGYGAGTLASHHLTRASGDNGIDGIIHEDALGLDAVYIQAKRYAADNRVSRPAIQQFIGSLSGEGATKGVFVTTSDFSKDARDYLKKVTHRVVLINGTELARLMITHGVGVRDRIAYVVRGVDEDYFSDPEG